jgi:hypothetical protein
MNYSANIIQRQLGLHTTFGLITGEISGDMHKNIQKYMEYADMSEKYAKMRYA